MTNNHLKPNFRLIETDEGGSYYIAIIEDYQTGNHLWVCNHRHYRPEYNSRYKSDPKKVWEYSALNCARKAREQWGQGTVVGAYGLIDAGLHNGLRDDVMIMFIDSVETKGLIYLDNNGLRKIEVTVGSSGLLMGTIYPDHPTRTVLPRTTNQNKLNRWATAAWLLKNAAWGVSFQDPSLTLDVNTNPAGVKEILEPLGLADRTRPEGAHTAKPKKATAKKSAKKETEKASVVPRLRVGRDENDKRIFEIVDQNDQVLDSAVHRGVAVEKMAKIKAKQ